jgi:hypothetical protein
MNGFRENSKFFFFFFSNGLKFVFWWSKMIFWVIFGPVGLRWGRRRWPISGPVEIKYFRRCPMAHLQKSCTITEAQLWRPKTKKEKKALNQKEFQKGWIKVLTVLSYFHAGV